MIEVTNELRADSRRGAAAADGGQAARQLALSGFAFQSPMAAASPHSAQSSRTPGNQADFLDSQARLLAALAGAAAGPGASTSSSAGLAAGWAASPGGMNAAPLAGQQPSQQPSWPLLPPGASPAAPAPSL